MNALLLKSWWIYLLNGFIALSYGLVALFIPAETIKVMAWYGGLTILLAGILMLLLVINRIRKELPYGWMLFQTILYIAAGTIIMLYTTESIRFFVIIIGLLALVAGVLQLLVLVNIQAYFGSKNLMLVNALVTLAFGLVMMFNPFEAAKALVVLSGIMGLFFGAVLVWFSLQLKKLQKEAGTILHEQDATEETTTEELTD